MESFSWWDHWYILLIVKFKSAPIFACYENIYSTISEYFRKDYLFTCLAKGRMSCSSHKLGQIIFKLSVSWKMDVYSDPVHYPSRASFITSSGVSLWGASKRRVYLNDLHHIKKVFKERIQQAINKLNEPNTTFKVCNELFIRPENWGYLSYHLDFASFIIEEFFLHHPLTHYVQISIVWELI